MELRWNYRKLRLKETFAIAHGSFDYRMALLVQLEHEGHFGYGECIEITYYGVVLKEFESTLATLSKMLKVGTLLHPFEFYVFLQRYISYPFLLSALDCAYWDLYGKVLDKSFGELNALKTELPLSSLTVTISPLEEQIHKIVNSKWPFFKVKCVGLDLAQVESLVETGKKIALDANTSFTPEDCESLTRCEFANALMYVEQPLFVGQFKPLSRNDRVQWMADEDVHHHSDLDKLRNHYGALNVKLMKCGGLTPALDLILKAKLEGFKVMIGCMTESSVGISAGMALAPLCDFADLDGAVLISNDDAIGSFVREGTLHLSSMPGLGIEMKKKSN